MINFVKTQKWIYSFVKQLGTDSQDCSYLLELLFLLLSLYIQYPSSTPSSSPTCFKWVHLNSFPTGCYLAINRIKVDMMEDVIFIHMTWQFLVWFRQVIIHTTTTWRGKIWMFQPFMYYFQWPISTVYPLRLANYFNYLSNSIFLPRLKCSGFSCSAD